MGQKVNPIGLRIGINKGWQSRWFATKDYAKLLKEDLIIRKIIEDQLGNAGISKIEMERTAEEVKIDMHTSKPGMVIGRRGATINDIRKLIEDTTGNIVQLNIVEVKKPELVAKLRETDETKNIPVIMLTARSFAVDDEQKEKLKIGGIILGFALLESSTTAWIWQDYLIMMMSC